MMKHLALCTLLALAALAPSRDAAALGFWVGLRGDYFAVNSDLLGQTEDDFAGGAELGLDISFFRIYVEALALQTDAYLFTANAGVDFSFGERVALHLGAFTGPMLFLFPDAPAASTVDFGVLSGDEQQALLAAGGWASLDAAEAEFDVFSEEESDLNRLGFGWNLLRARAAVDFNVAGPLHLGVAGSFGYHMLLSGEDAAAGAKNEALDQFTDEYGLTTSLRASLADAIGAAPVNQDELDGFNWDANLYLTLYFGL